MRRRLAGYAVRLALSLVVLGTLARRVDWPGVPAALASMQAEWLAAALLLLAAGTMVRIWSFMLVTNHADRLVTFRQSAYLTFVGSAAALVMPSGTGELFKAHIAGKALGAPEHLVVSSIIDKLTSLAAVAAMGAVGGLVTGQPTFAAIAAVLCAITSILVFVPRLIPWRIVTRTVALRADVDDVQLASAMAMPRSMLTGVLALSVVGWLLTYSMVYSVTRAMGAEVTPGLMLTIGPLMTLATLLPLSVAGIGLSQATLATMLVGAGVPAQTAAHAAIGQLSLSLLTPLIGLVLYATVGDRRWAGRRSGRTPVHVHRVSNTGDADAPRRVTMLTTVFPRTPGDALGNFIAAAARALAATGRDVTVIAPHAPGLAAAEEDGPVHVRRFRYLPERFERLAYTPLGIPEALRHNKLNLLALPFFALGFWREARRAARAGDILHAHWAPVGAIAVIAAGRLSPVVLSLHGTDVALAARRGVWRTTLALACRRAAAVLPVSAEMAERLTGLVRGLPAERVQVIGMGVDPVLLDIAEPPERSGIAFVGRLTEAKGAFDAVRALAALYTAAHLRPHVMPRLVLVGAGDPEPIQDLARQLDVLENIEITGPLAHKQALDIIASATVLLLPSAAEGLPLVVLEAAALGTPVIASNVGGIAEALGGDEWLFPSGDVSASAELLSRAFKDPAALQSAACRARERVRAEHTWPVVAGRIAKIYDFVSEPD